MDNQTVLWSALLMGLLSACSLPLGTLTSAIWRPGDRSLAALMAFGGGALLAALTIDLAGPALAKGHFSWLALGCVTGGLLFVMLDQIVNNHGGFLRKASTTVFHLRRREQKRFQRIFRKIRRVKGAASFPRAEAMDLASTVSSAVVAEGVPIFRDNDPCDYFFIIEEGSVQLLDPDRGNAPHNLMKRKDAFGYLAFFTGCPHTFTAIAKEETHLLLVPRDAFLDLLVRSEDLQEYLVHYLRDEDTLVYLRDRQGLEESQIATWLDQVEERLAAGHTPLCPLGEPSPKPGEMPLSQCILEVKRAPFLQNLTKDDREELQAKCFRKEHLRGHTFYHAGEPAERLYFVVEGEVALVDPSVAKRERELIPPGEVFGIHAFLTGARHSKSAVAATDAVVWILRKSDFDDLVRHSPTFAAAVEAFIQEGEIGDYLAQKQHFDSDKAARWVRRATENLHSSKLLPSASAMKLELKHLQGAPLAIWLGILLDGVPESMVIGASILHKSTVSFSLIAGLFLSNFPEALSSSVVMRQQGMRFGRILLMWTSLMLITGMGAALGTIFFREAPPETYSLVEGVAAGAMLTMIAQTMLPEAYLKGGAISGFSTLLGFLAAIFFKTLEGGGGH